MPSSGRRSARCWSSTPTPIPRCWRTTSAATWMPCGRGCEMSDSYLEDLFGLSGQVAVVIGGTGVLGGALAQGVAQAGATVVVAGRDPGRGEARVNEIEGVGGRAAFAPVDVMRRDSIAGLLRQVLDTQGRVDMLING